MKHNLTEYHSTPIQLKLPVDLERKIKISDAIYSFSEIMAQIDLKKYFAVKERKTGRTSFDREKLFKTVLFASMEFGCCTVRRIQELCKTDIRFLWLLDEDEAPSHMTIENFIKDELTGSMEPKNEDEKERLRRKNTTGTVALRKNLSTTYPQMQNGRKIVVCLYFETHHYFLSRFFTAPFLR